MYPIEMLVRTLDLPPAGFTDDSSSIKNVKHSIEEVLTTALSRVFRTITVDKVEALLEHSTTAADSILTINVLLKIPEEPTISGEVQITSIEDMELLIEDVLSSALLEVLGAIVVDKVQISPDQTSLPNKPSIAISTKIGVTDSINIIVCYAHEDKALRDELAVHLSSLKRQYRIKEWYDREISPGIEWEREIDTHLNLAHVILLLVSPHFMASDFSYSLEMKRAIDKHEAGTARVIPIILRPVDWEDAPFSSLQMLPTDARPITRWPDRDAAFLDVAREIRKAVRDVQLSLKMKEEWLKEGDALYNLKRYDEALATYEQALRLDPKYAPAYNSKGNTLRNLKRYDEALATYEQAIRLEPANALAYSNKGGILRIRRRYGEALAAYEQVIRLEPTNVLAYNNKGNILRNLKRYSEAIAAYEQTIRLEPTNALAYSNKGNILRNLKRYDEALAAYEQAIHLEPTNALAYSNKGITLYNLKRHEEALAAYEQAIQLDPQIENLVIAESPKSLLMRIKSVQQFLVEAGFDFRATSNPISFVATPRSGAWHERFPRGWYVRVLFDEPLDQRTVQSVYQDAKEYSDYALVVINRQPEISGWMVIGGLRTEEKNRFVFLPIAESLIKEGTALKKEFQTLSFYINKHLGQDFDPYDVRDPVSDAVNFFGRESLTDEILNALRSGQRLGLFGLHKIGKTSVLQRLQKKSEFPVSYVYLRNGDSLISIYQRILKGWLIDIQIKFPNLTWNTPQFTSGSDLKMIFDLSAKDLLLLLRSVMNIPLLGIFLDEIEHIVPYKEGDEDTLSLYMNLMDSLRGMQQETNSLFLLVAGVHPYLARRNYFWGNQKNPMHQVISERFLLPLDKEDCAYMIRSLGQQINLRYDAAALEFIIQMSGAHPFLARQICSLAYKNRGDMNTVSLQNAQKAAQDFVSNPATASYFDDYGLWGELGKPDIWGESISYANHSILRSLAASLGELAESDIHSGLNKKTTEQALTALKERGIISASDDPGSYSITFGLFRDWIRLHKLGLE